MNRFIKITRWTARILCILAILLVSMFALDAFEPGHSVWHQLLAFVIHMIPSFVLIVLLIIAWKWERIGGILLAVAGLAFGLFLFRTNRMHYLTLLSFVSTVMALVFPFLLSGVLFIISYYLDKKGPDGK
jgi:hypothetical protein